MFWCFDFMKSFKRIVNDIYLIINLFIVIALFFN